MKYTLIVVIFAILTFSALGQAKPPAPAGAAPAPAGAAPAAGATPAPVVPTLKFIDDGEAKKHLADPKGFTPKVMNNNDARDVLRKLVKERDTSFVI